jgi:hypothetical protein
MRIRNFGPNDEISDYAISAGEEGDPSAVKTG